MNIPMISQPEPLAYQNMTLNKLLKDERGMTLLELIVYIAIASIFMVAALFIMKSGNEFSIEMNQQIKAQNEIRIGSIWIKNSIKRYDFINGFKVEPLDQNNPGKGNQLIFYNETTPTLVDMRIYYDFENKQLVAESKDIKPICKLDGFSVMHNSKQQVVQIYMKSKGIDNYIEYNELIAYKTKK